MTDKPSALSRLMAAIGVTKLRRRDPRPRRSYYDGSESPELRPPGRYARGRSPVPPPPGGGV